MGELRRLRAGDLPAACDLLRSCELPVEDLDAHQMCHFVGLFEEGRIKALAGLVPDGDVGLLRSLCVDAPSRGRGLAGRIVDELERRAREDGVREIFLLTETAEAYFERRGYRREARDSAPAAIATSSQFLQVCPASAVLMVKSLV